jgi:hypothetical protein
VIHKLNDRSVGKKREGRELATFLPADTYLCFEPLWDPLLEPLCEPLFDPLCDPPPPPPQPQLIPPGAMRSSNFSTFSFKCFMTFLLLTADFVRGLFDNIRVSFALQWQAQFRVLLVPREVLNRETEPKKQNSPARFSTYAIQFTRRSNCPD